jgi:hypothetical protein
MAARVSPASAAVKAMRPHGNRALFDGVIPPPPAPARNRLGRLVVSWNAWGCEERPAFRSAMGSLYSMAAALAANPIIDHIVRRSCPTISAARREIYSIGPPTTIAIADRRETLPPAAALRFSTALARRNIGGSAVRQQPGLRPPAKPWPRHGRPVELTMTPLDQRLLSGGERQLA